MTTNLRNVYDAVAYPGHARPKSHPDNLAVIALLHGLETPDVATCRVLEIGCSRGNNIIPMAYAIPGAEFVGVDLAGNPIAYGQRKIEELRLRNIRLLQGDLMELGESLGRFDYIIAHGVYAWVAEPVREGLLALCQKLLSANGVAFVSYVTSPGGHVRRMTREMMLFDAGGRCEDAQGVSESLSYLQFLVEAMREDEPLRAALERELKQMQGKGASNVFHDELEEGYEPISFFRFIAHAARHGLQYLGDSGIPPPNDPSFQPEIAAHARKFSGGDRIAEEQTYDFVRMRMYRETLLCRAEREISPDLNLLALGRLRLASRAQPAETSETGVRVYRVEDGKRIESQHAGVAFILDALAEAWPRSVPMEQLQRLLVNQGIDLDADLLTRIVRLFVSRVLELHTWQAPVSAEITRRPRVSGWFRRSLSEPYGAATLLHTDATFGDPLLRDLTLLLDGTRDRAELLQALCARHPETAEGEIASGMEPALRFLHRAGLLLDETIA